MRKNDSENVYHQQPESLQQGEEVRQKCSGRIDREDVGGSSSVYQTWNFDTSLVISQHPTETQEKK